VNDEAFKGLVMRFIEGRASPEETAALSRRLVASEAARKYFLQVAQLHAALSTQLPEALAAQTGNVRPAFRVRRWIWPAFAVAASIVLVTLLLQSESPFLKGSAMASSKAAAEIEELREDRWSGANGAIRVGTTIRCGQSLELLSGSATVRFKSGALVTMLGHCSLEATSINETFLRLGQIKVRADDVAAKGFTVGTRTARIVDVGTEFVAAAAPDGQSRVDVTSGEVYVVLEGAKTQHVLREGDAFSVEAGGAQVMVRIERGDGTAAFRFPTIEPPSEHDDADRSRGQATIRLARGELYKRVGYESGPPELLLDGRGQPVQDSPANSVFFDNEMSGGLLLDLGRPILIEKINTYSWHQSPMAQNRVRAVQKYLLYGYAGDAPPAMDGDVGAAGWTLIARVNSDDFFRVVQPTERPAQQACSITGARGSVGRYRFLLWLVEPTQAIDPRFFNNTFYSEFDVYARQ